MPEGMVCAAFTLLCIGIQEIERLGAALYLSQYHGNQILTNDLWALPLF